MKNSAVIRLILDLATYGYILSPDWKSKSRGRSAQQLAQSFCAVMSRWEKFEHTTKFRVEHEGSYGHIKDRLLGCYSGANVFTFYQVDVIRDQARAQEYTISNTTEMAVTNINFTPWIEHPVNAGNCSVDWDATQNLLVYGYHYTRQVFAAPVPVKSLILIFVALYMLIRYRITHFIL